jgi:hypothetical protein
VHQVQVNGLAVVRDLWRSDSKFHTLKTAKCPCRNLKHRDVTGALFALGTDVRFHIARRPPLHPTCAQ